MAVSVSIFSALLEPGNRIRIVPLGDIRLTTVTFGENIKEETGRTTVKCYQALPPDDSDEEKDEDEDQDQGDEEDLAKPVAFEKDATVITHLTPGRIETQTVDLVLPEDEPIEFEVTGKNPVQLLGNYIIQNPELPDGYGSGMDESDEDELDTDDEEGGYALEEVSSDVEVDPSTMVGLDIDSDDVADPAPTKIVEVTEETTVTASPQSKKEKKGKEKEKEKEKEDKKEEKKDKKRARESDAVMADVEGESGAKLSKKEKKKNKKLKAENGTAVPTGADEPKTYDKVEKHTLPSGISVDVRTVGDGPGAKAGQTLSMRYIGRLENKTVFDKNTKGKPFTFKLGAGEVIKGWDQGIVGLKQGAEAIITIPPDLAYGNKKVPNIPANSTLKFEVKVLEIK